MSINKSSYDRLSWVDALKARKEPRDYETRYASISEKDAIDNALEETVEAVFNVHTSEETSEQAISRGSKDAADAALTAANMVAVNEIKAKLANRDDPIDPVELGIQIRHYTEAGSEVLPLTQEEWDNANDPTWTENVARMAALAFQQRKDMSWEDAGMMQKKTARSFEPEYSKGGKLMSSHSENDDSAPRFGKTPIGTNSISNPELLDKLAQEAQQERNKIEAAKREKKEAQQKRAEGERDSAVKGLISKNEGSRLMRSGGNDSEVFIQKVPRNQVSMTDDLTKGLEDLFLEKFQTNDESIKKAAEEHRMAIQEDREATRKEDRKLWEKVDKPISTGSLQERLLKLWIPETEDK